MTQLWSNSRYLNTKQVKTTVIMKEQYKDWKDKYKEISLHLRKAKRILKKFMIS